MSASTSGFGARLCNMGGGSPSSVASTAAAHRDVDAISAAGVSAEERRTLELGAAENLKRVHVLEVAAAEDWFEEARFASPELIESFVEIKTLWHPSAS